ncbi:hypothetical protein BGW80DRAFT_815611 [Lactifluus volemus]|nr:hypothetical protein BGW80DRAFT_815611 [Lactifluus volemus]
MPRTWKEQAEAPDGRGRCTCLDVDPESILLCRTIVIARQGNPSEFDGEYTIWVSRIRPSNRKVLVYSNNACNILFVTGKSSHWHAWFHCLHGYISNVLMTRYILRSAPSSHKNRDLRLFIKVDQRNGSCRFGGFFFFESVGLGLYVHYHGHWCMEHT